MNNDLLIPRVGLYVGSSKLFVPVIEAEVEITAYNHSDTARCTTFCAGSPDFGALSQATPHMPYVVKSGVVGSSALANVLFNGYMDEIDTTYESDTITLSARGLLSLLIDVKTTQKPNQNVDVGTVISNLITGQGLTAEVGTAGVLVGKLLKDDNITTARNIRIMDYIATLANGVGWQTRVRNDTVIVGPPATTGIPTILKQHGKGGDLRLTVKHSALHAHNIKVKVVSYVPKKKAATSSLTAADLVLLNGQAPPIIPVPVSPSRASSGGNQSGSSSVGATDTEVETYTFNFPGKDAAACDAIAALIQADLSRHEFIAEIEWAPTADEIAVLSQQGCEVLINLTGCSQGSHNQLYHPKRITWTYNFESGMLVNILMVNHLLPQDTAGQVNT